MTDKDINIKRDDSVEPELLGVELSEEIKKIGNDFIEAVVQTPDIETSPVETPVKTEEKEPDLEIKSEEPISSVPKKEFSMPEQSRQIEEIVDAYTPAPSLVNSSS